jgi:hypothetical protein
LSADELRYLETICWKLAHRPDVTGASSNDETEVSPT